MMIGNISRALAVVVNLVAVGCTTSEVGKHLRDDAAWEPRTITESGRLTLHSPYGPQMTDSWAMLLEFQVDRVGALFGLDPTKPQLVRLVPAPLPPATGDAHLDLFRAASTTRSHISGYVGHRDGAPIVLYVPDDEEHGYAALIGKTDILRHELSHVLCRRIELDALPHWLDEGLAEMVETLDENEAGEPRWDGLTPLALGRSDLAGPGDLDALLRWPHMGRDLPTDPVATRRLYDLSHSLVLFLMRRMEGSFPERARAVAALSPEDLRALDGEWLSWQANIDLLAEARAAAVSADPLLREDAFQRLCVLFPSLRQDDAASRECAALAVAALEDAATFEPASRFLTLGGHHPLSDERIGALASDPQPRIRLTGLALILRRGGSPDRAAVAEAWEAAVAKDPTRVPELMWLEQVLDIETATAPTNSSGTSPDRGAPDPGDADTSA